MLNVYDTIATVTRDVLKLEGVEKMKDADLLKLTEEHLVETGKMPAKLFRLLEEITKAKKDYHDNKLTKVDIEKVHLDSSSLIKFFVEHMQRKRSRDLDRLKIRIKHGNKFGEAIMLGKEAFIIYDIDNEEKEISKARINENGNFENIEKSSLEELEKSLSTIETPIKMSLKEGVFEDLKKIFGKEMEILMSY